MFDIHYLSTKRKHRLTPVVFFYYKYLEISALGDLPCALMINPQYYATLFAKFDISNHR